MTDLDHDRQHGHRPHEQAAADACCVPAAVPAGGSSGAAGPGWLHIPSMDCAAEESEIRG